MRKATYLIIIAVVIAASFMSCSNTGNKDSEDVVACLENFIENGTEIKFNGENSVIYFNNDQIVYLDQINKATDTPNYSVKSYNMLAEESVDLYTIERFALSFGTTVQVKNKIYYPYATVQLYLDEEIYIDNILEVDLEKLEGKLLEIAPTGNPAVFLHASDEFLFRKYYITEDEIDKCRIDRIDISNYEVETIYETHYAHNSGRIIISLDVESDWIHALIIDVESERIEYHVEIIDIKGNSISSFELGDMKDALDISDETGTDDIEYLYSIRKIDDYYFIESLNGLQFVFKINGNSVKKIVSPPLFETLLSPRFLMNKNGCVFYCDVLYRYFYFFDKQNESFGEIEISSRSINRMLVNASGSMIILDDNNKLYYYD